MSTFDILLAVFRVISRADWDGFNNGVGSLFYITAILVLKIWSSMELLYLYR